MKYLILLLVGLSVFCDDPVSPEEPKVTIIVDYMYYEYGHHGPLYITHNNEILYILQERDYDTLEVPEDWIEFKWTQRDSYEKEVFPKHMRKYKVYNTMFEEVDHE